MEKRHKDCVRRTVVQMEFSATLLLFAGRPLLSSFIKILADEAEKQCVLEADGLVAQEEDGGIGR